MLFLWLGDVGAQVSIVTLITTAWWIVTSYNIPFYFTIQAIGQENVVARNTWMRIALIALGCAVYHKAAADALSVSWLVLATGLLAEIQFYAEAQLRARLLTMAIADRHDCIVLIGSLALIASACWLRIDTTFAAAGMARLAGAFGVFVGIWLVLLTIATRGNPVRFLRGVVRRSAEAGAHGE